MLQKKCYRRKCRSGIGCWLNDAIVKLRGIHTHAVTTRVRPVRLLLFSLVFFLMFPFLLVFGFCADFYCFFSIFRYIFGFRLQFLVFNFFSFVWFCYSFVLRISFVFLDFFFQSVFLIYFFMICFTFYAFLILFYCLFLFLF